MRVTLPFATAMTWAAVCGAGCGEDPLHATFTSRVVQHEVCTVLGEQPEQCQQAETLLDLRVRLLERDADNIWLFGVPRAGVTDRALLGSRNDEDGFSFVEEVSIADSETECSVVERLELVLTIDPAADPEAIGTDDCVALLGRENVITSSSAGCDAVNQPPLAETRLARRRWEQSPQCDDRATD